MGIVMTFEERVNELIGKPYDEANYHCWDLVCDLLPDAPKVNGSAASLTASVKSFKSALVYTQLKEVQEYENEDIIILGRFDTYYHAGVYYGGGLIHATHGGVAYQRMSDIKKVYTRIKGLRI